MCTQYDMGKHLQPDKRIHPSYARPKCALHGCQLASNSIHILPVGQQMQRGSATNQITSQPFQPSPQVHTCIHPNILTYNLDSSSLFACTTRRATGNGKHGVCILVLEHTGVRIRKSWTAGVLWHRVDRMLGHLGKGRVLTEQRDAQFPLMLFHRYGLFGA